MPLRPLLLIALPMLILVAAVSDAAAPAPPGAPARKPGAFATAFQTNLDYDPRVDLKADVVFVHQHGRKLEEIGASIASWKQAGYTVYRMFFIGADPGGYYTTGKHDGQPHEEIIERNAAGDPIAIGNRPYVIPDAGWINYLKTLIRRAIDAGASGILPEEPLLHAAGGYSEAFKRAWKERYGSDWQAPNSSPAVFFQASKLKAELYHRATTELLEFTREYAKAKGRQVQFILPVHSPVGYANWKLVYPTARAVQLPLDGYIAQVWTGPARFPLMHAGRERTDVFQQSWLLYSSSVNLLRGSKKPLYLLADPVEDDPNFSWDQYRKWYEQGLAASLLFPADGYEVLPWPDRVYLPGYSTGGKTPAPAPYLAELGNLRAVLADLAGKDALDWGETTLGVGVLSGDTLMWQRGGPQGSSVRSLQGLVTPLLADGIPVQIVPLERAGDPRLLLRFQILLLSYDAFKPLSPDAHVALAQWTRQGGVLIVFAGADGYDDIPSWWREAGFNAPHEHLFQLCELGVKPAGRQVRLGLPRFEPHLAETKRVRDLSNRENRTIPIGKLAAEGQPVYVRFADAFPEDGWGSRLGRVIVREGKKIRADFKPGSVVEKLFLTEDLGSQLGKDYRFADGERSFTYRFNRLKPETTLEVDLGNQFQVTVAVGEPPQVKLRTTIASLKSLEVPRRYPVTSYPLLLGQPLYQIEDDPARGVAWASPSGQGRVLFCGLPAAFGAETAAGADLVRSLVRLSAKRYAKMPYHRRSAWIVRRKPYVIAAGLTGRTKLRGVYLNLLDPEMPLLDEIEVARGEVAILKDVRDLMRGNVPRVLHATHRARVVASNQLVTEIRLAGPEGSPGILRLFPANKTLREHRAIDADGKPVEVEIVRQARTLLVRYPQKAKGFKLTLRWTR